ncbi:MAG: LamG domain-containing protein, partial [Cytophagales bacterium]
SVPNNAVFEFADGTLEFWIKPTYTSSPGYNPCMVSNRNNGGGASDTRYSYHMTGGKTAIELYNGTTVSTWSYTFNTNEWYYVSIVESGTTVEVFVNGISIGTRTTGSSAITGRVFNIGSSGSAERFQGQIEEVRVWNTARTQAQIRESMHLTLSGAESGLVAYYQFNETKHA